MADKKKTKKITKPTKKAAPTKNKVKAKASAAKTVRKAKPAAKKSVKPKLKAKAAPKTQSAKKAPAKKPAVKTKAKAPANKAKKTVAPTIKSIKKAPAIKDIKTKTSVPKTPIKVATKKTVLDTLDYGPYPIEQHEDYMNESHQEHFQKILELWKQQLMQEVDSTVVHMKEDTSIAYPDPLDRAAQEEGFNLELRTRDRERKLIKKIEQSLEAIKNGEYGYCEDCGAEIGIRRLEARPTADKCIDCKTYEEIKEKQVGA